MSKVIALFMPQFHVIPENSKWWGEGYTEWDNVRGAKKYHKEQYQPREPLNDNYYCLLDEDEQVRQSNLAMKYGVYGFCYYHYWFTGKKLLERPMELMLSNNNVKIPFCISWANHTWRRSQSTDEKYILLEQKYGDKKDWISHFEYLLPFFKDSRYILCDGKPLFIIHDSTTFDGWKEMFSLWNKMAIENGLKGIYFVNTLKSKSNIQDTKKYRFDAQFEFQPTFALYNSNKLAEYTSKVIRNLYRDYLKKVQVIDYEHIWRRILKFHEYEGCKTFLGAFVDWDNTPRWKNRGSFYKGVTPERFGNFLDKLFDKSETEYIFVNAWNEWGEGAYLEPDKKYKLGYLESLNKCVEKHNK